MVKIAAVVLALPLVVPAHDHWISRDKLMDPLSGKSCCNEDDCEALPADSVKEVGTAFYIETTKEMFPSSRVLWKSADGRWWRCAPALNGEKFAGETRCLIGTLRGM